VDLAASCKHQLKRPFELLVDAAGKTVLIYECLICGAQFGLSDNSEGEVGRMLDLPTRLEMCLEPAFEVALN
jgi:hypothetical protein